MAEQRRFTRRQVLVAGGVGAAAIGGGAAAVVRATGGDDAGAGYPRLAITKVGDLEPGAPVEFEYPLKGQRSVLIDLGEGVPGGVGEANSIVAYSVLCQHMGCPVPFESEQKTFLCPCHQTKYDPARQGCVVQGVAPTGLPRIDLQIDGDDIVAVGVHGLIYGYRNNLAPGEQVA